MKRAILSLAAFGLLLSSLTACTQNQKLGPLRKGRALEEHGEYVVALDHYQRMKDVEFREECLNNLHYLYGDILDAMSAINGTEAPSAEQYYALGDAYYDTAESIPQGAVRPNAEFDLETYFAQKTNQLHTKALTALEQAQQSAPHYGEALLLEGVIYEEQEKSEQAIAAYQKLLEYEPENVEAIVRLSRLVYAQDKHQKGLKLAQQAVALSPENPKAHFALGNIYAREGQRDLARDEFHQTLCLDPHYPEVYYLIGQIFLARNDLIDAERIIRLGTVNNPDSLKMRVFYTGLKSVLDQQEQEDVLAIIRQFEGPDAPNNLRNVRMAEQNILVQLRYYKLRLKLLERQRPYSLGCSGTEEHPFFEKQIRQTQDKIQEINELLASAE